MLDLTDREHGLRLVIEIKSGFNPDAVLEQLYKHTPMEDSFGINNVALVDGQPRTLGLRELLVVWVEHRLTVVRRRSEYRLARRRERLHLVEGLLIAIVDIDEVIQVIRSSDTADVARDRLMGVFDLSQAQADYILELRLRRLTRFSTLELEREAGELREEIADLEDDPGRRRPAADRGQRRDGRGRAGRSARRGAPSCSSTPAARADRRGGDAPLVGRRRAALEIADTPCVALLSGTGPGRPHGRRRCAGARRPPGRARRGGGRGAHHHAQRRRAPSPRAGACCAWAWWTCPALPPTDGPPSLSGGAPVDRARGAGARRAGGRPDGRSARTRPPSRSARPPAWSSGWSPRTPRRARDAWEVIGLKDGDEVVGAVPVTDSDELVLVTSDAQLLHFPASAVRPQGRPAGGMAGDQALRRRPGALRRCGERSGRRRRGDRSPARPTRCRAPRRARRRSARSRCSPPRAGPPAACAPSASCAARTACCWPGWAPAPARASGSAGQAIELPEPDQRRDGSGVPLPAPVHTIG